MLGIKVLISQITIYKNNHLNVTEGVNFESNLRDVVKNEFVFCVCGITPTPTPTSDKLDPCCAMSLSPFLFINYDLVASASAFYL